MQDEIECMHRVGVGPESLQASSYGFRSRWTTRVNERHSFERGALSGKHESFAAGQELRDMARLECISQFIGSRCDSALGFAVE